ncbi:MAG: Dynamin family protein [Desulfobacterales bacterium]|nr:Dynamin family protein [Desulfobacterales bacterium]
MFKDNMYKDNYINSLRNDIIEVVEEYLSPVALNYGYSEVPLESGIKWKPIVLLIGNYSSGKSTLINEFLGCEVQMTGQAPTDDSFTIITGDSHTSSDEETRVTEERDGKVLLNDPEYPFESLKKHGQKFASHFRLKKVNSDFLNNIAIVDTPGMLDSISERDRGYNYQEVIGDIAQLADLILVLFDPHKAGTVREAHISLRETLPERTFEERVHYVLNRIDECSSLTDLLQVFGTLCWNLSQITGRKDIPVIHLSYSKSAVKNKTLNDEGFLKHLDNRHEKLKETVLKTPHSHLDNLVSFLELHSTRISHLLETLINYKKKMKRHNFKTFIRGSVLSLFISGFAGCYCFFGGYDSEISALVAFSSFSFLMFLWTIVAKMFSSKYHDTILSELDSLTILNNQTREDSWNSIKGIAETYLKKTKGKFSLKKVKKDFSSIEYVDMNETKEFREGISEVTSIHPDEKFLQMK